jgi:hypothetical protein
MANECTAIVKLVGVPGAAPTGFKHVRGELAGVLADMVGTKFMHLVTVGTVSLYRVTDEKKEAAETAFIKDEADAKAKYGATRVKAEEALTANSWLLAVGTLQQAAPSSTTGKCPHIIVVPTVARSSLTWSRCFVCPLCGCFVQGAQVTQVRRTFHLANRHRVTHQRALRCASIHIICLIAVSFIPAVIPPTLLQ